MSGELYFCVFFNRYHHHRRRRCCCRLHQHHLRRRRHGEYFFDRYLDLLRYVLAVATRAEPYSVEQDPLTTCLSVLVGTADSEECVWV